MVALDLHFPSHHRNDGADGRSVGIVRCGGRSAALAFAASSNVWSCTSVWACGFCSGLPVPRLPVVVWRRGGRRRCDGFPAALGRGSRRRVRGIKYSGLLSSSLSCAPAAALGP